MQSTNLSATISHSPIDALEFQQIREGDNKNDLEQNKSKSHPNEKLMLDAALIAPSDLELIKASLLSESLNPNENYVAMTTQSSVVDNFLNLQRQDSQSKHQEIIDSSITTGLSFQNDQNGNNSQNNIIDKTTLNHESIEELRIKQSLIQPPLRPNQSSSSSLSSTSSEEERKKQQKVNKDKKNNAFSSSSDQERMAQIQRQNSSSSNYQNTSNDLNGQGVIDNDVLKVNVSGVAVDNHEQPKQITVRQLSNNDNQQSSDDRRTASDENLHQQLHTSHVYNPPSNPKQQQIQQEVEEEKQHSQSQQQIAQPIPQQQTQQQQLEQREQDSNAIQQQLDQSDQQPQSVQQKQQQDDQDDEDEEEEDDDDDDDEPIHSESSFVVEVSPKGRFKRFGEELGRGAYKIVYKGIDNETGREIAWNVINLKRLPKQDRIRIKSEIDLIKILEHKNIIHFISAWVNKQKEQVIFITEMITGGSLRKYVKKIKHPRLRVIKGWCTEILQGLVYLHEQKPHPIIHRDLKCDNIFINSNSGEIRIGDLGLSTPMQNSFTTSVLGTPEFMAPELYEECYGTSVDIYAFGMCVLEMITLERPYKECQNPAQIYNKVVQGIRPMALERIEDEEVKDFILQCLISADRRPSANDLLDSKFIKEIESEKNNREVKVKPALKSKGPKRKKSLQYMKKHGSTILEEEEENSEDDSEKRKQQAIERQQQQQDLALQQKQQKNSQSQSQIQKQLQHEQDLKTDQIASNQLDKQEILQNQEAKFQSMVVQSQQLNVQDINDASNHATQKQQQHQTMQAAEQQQQQVQNTLLINPNNQNNLQIPKKKKKSGSKKKKLDESVSFLKQIDREKQKKLQERTMQHNPDNIDDSDDDDDDDANNDNQNDSDDNGNHNDVNMGGQYQSNQKAPQENILQELLQQDRELEKQKYEQEQQMMQQYHQQQIQHQQQQQLSQKNSDVSLPQQQHEQQVQSQQQQQQLYNNQHKQQNYYDSSDQNNPKTPNNNTLGTGFQQLQSQSHSQVLTQQQNHGTLTATNQQNRQSTSSFQSMTEQQKKDKKEAGLFGKSKNFKEDVSPTPSGTSQASQKKDVNSITQQSTQKQGNQQQQNKQDTKGNTNIPGTMSDDLRKAQLRETQSHQQDLQQQRNIITQSQVSQDKPGRQNPQQYHQSSDSHLSSQSAATSNLNRQNTKTIPHVGSHIVEPHPQESLFDVQSSSEEDSEKNHDSEVENIQLPKSQVDIEHQLYGRNYPITPYSESNQQQQFNRNSTEGLTNQLKKSNTNRYIDYKTQGGLPQQVQQNPFQQMNQASQNQGLSKTQSHPVSQNSKSLQNQDQDRAKPKLQNQDLRAQSSNQQNQQQQQQNQSSNPQNKQQKETSQPHQQQQYSNAQNKPPQSQFQPNNQQQQRSTTITNVPNAHTQPQVQPQPLVYLHSAAKVDDKSQVFDITFKVRSQDGTQDKEVFFTFDTREDTAKGVAEEMVRELKLPTSQIQVIENLIKSIVQKKEAPVQQSQPIQQQVQPENQQLKKQPTITQDDSKKQTPQNQDKKDSPLKISKDQAISQFNKLFDNIDLFFQYMQNKNITSINEIISAMEGNQDEVALKNDFLNQVLIAKKQYKRGMEEYKKKVESKKKQQVNAQLSDAQSKPKTQGTERQAVSKTTNIQPSSQQQNQANLKKQTTQDAAALKRVSSSQDMGSYGASSSHDEERKQQPHQQNQKLSFLIPTFVRKQFKVAPALIQINQKLQYQLKKVENESTQDQEVMSLQNMLNLIFEISVIEMMNSKSLTPESQNIVQNYIPLRIDGFFGEKTESQVLKFQKHIKAHEDGIVNEFIWQTLISYVDHIIKDDQKKQALLQQQIQQQQLKTQAQEQKAQQQQVQIQQQQQPLPSKELVINTAAQVQLITINPPKQTSQGSKQAQSQAPQQKQQSTSSQQTSQQQRVSPNKHQKKNQVQSQQEIDYQTTLEQAFREGVQINRFSNDIEQINQFNPNYLNGSNNNNNDYQEQDQDDGDYK